MPFYIPIKISLKVRKKTDIYTCTFIIIYCLREMATRTLGAVDYVLLVILLLASAVIGVIFGFFKSKKNSAKEFLLGIIFQTLFLIKIINIFSLYYS